MKKQTPSKTEIAALLQAKAAEFADIAVRLEQHGTPIDMMLAGAARGVSARYAQRAERMCSGA